MSNGIEATTQPMEVPLSSPWLILLSWLALPLWLVLAGWILKAAGIFRATAIVGPRRMAAGEGPAVLVLLFIAGLGGVMVGGGLAGGLPVAQAWRGVVVGAMGYLGGAAVILAGSAIVRRQGLQRLGLTARQMLPAGWQALVAMIALLPLVYAMGLLMDWLTRVLDIPGPVHTVLTQLKLAEHPAGAALLVVSAVVLAPLFEELLFRGIMQTFVVRLLAGPEADSPASEMIGRDSALAQEGGLAGTGPQAAEMPDTQAWPPRGIMARWAAIAITSLVFAAVHGQWLWIAPLFVLSVGFGYAYEKTGNLWVPIFMHALFNGTQIAIFLSISTSGT